MNFITRNISATTASISASGTGFAAPIGASAALRPLAPVVLALALMANGLPGATAELEVSVDGLRSDKGQVMLCLTKSTDFLECDKDPAHVSRIVPAARADGIRLRGLQPGQYSLLVVHDENGNGKLDTRVGIPREGFGFSNNPKLRLGPPKYRSVTFEVKAGRNPQEIRVRYIL